jgi:hypothetical protein
MMIVTKKTRTTVMLARFVSGIVVALAVSILPPASAGEVYKCRGANGDVTFTNIKCPERSTSEHYGTYQKVPDSPDRPQLSVDDDEAALPQSHMNAAPLPQTSEKSQGHDADASEVSNIVRCTRPDGTTYYRRNACGTSHVEMGNTSHISSVPSGPVFDRVTGAPIAGAFWTGPSQAFDPNSGRYLEGTQVMQPFRHGEVATTPVPDSVEHIGKAEGCDGAKEMARDVRSKGGSFDARRKADDRVWDLCKRPANSTRDP